MLSFLGFPRFRLPTFSLSRRAFLGDETEDEYRWSEKTVVPLSESPSAAFLSSRRGRFLVESKEYPWSDETSTTFAKGIRCETGLQLQKIVGTVPLGNCFFVFGGKWA